MKNQTKDYSKIPCIVERDGIVAEVNEALLCFTGFTPDELLGKEFEYVWFELLLISVDPTFTEDHAKAFLFTNGLKARNVFIQKKFIPNGSGTSYYIWDNPYSKLYGEFPYTDYLFSDGKVGVAMYSVPDLILLRANQAYLDFLDEPYNNMENSIGRNKYTIVSGFAGSHFEKLFLELINTGKVLDVREEPFTGYARGLTYWDTTVTPVLENNCIKYIIQVSHDVTEAVKNKRLLAEQNIEIEAQKKQLEAAMKIKEEFIYNITHELRTPSAIVSSALQAIDLMYKKEVTPHVRKHLSTIKQNTNRQLRLINNLLDITKLSSGNIRLNKTDIDIVYLTRSIVDSVDVYAGQKGIRTRFDSDIPAKEIYLDEEKYERILLNLLSNAVKFTPENKNIYVRLSLKKKKRGGFVCVDVTDEGIGIPKDKKHLVFERFAQLDNSLSSQAEGTGLGLPLVKLLVEAMDGEISFTSEVGNGTTFTVLIPIEKPSAVQDQTACGGPGNRFMNDDSRIIRAASIEFSDIYFS